MATLTDFITKPIVEGQWHCSAAHRRILFWAPPVFGRHRETDTVDTVQTSGICSFVCPALPLRVRRAEQVLERVRQKATAYGRPPLPSAQSSPQLPPLALAESIAELSLGQAAQSSASTLTAPAPIAVASPQPLFKVAPEVIAQLYEIIMTLNKEVR